MRGPLASVRGNLLGSVFSTSGISYRPGLDGQLPAWFAQVHPRRRTSVNSILCQGLASLVLAASGSLVWLAVLSVCIRVLLHLLCLCSGPPRSEQGQTSRVAKNSRGTCCPGDVRATC